MAKKVQVKTKVKVLATKYDPKCRIVTCADEITGDSIIVVVEKPACGFRQEFENTDEGSKESLRVFIEKSDETC